jgi:Concanavalin A-like lectin/glucanases superfamily
MFRPKVPYLGTLTRLGLTGGLKLCLDAGDSASYSNGQSWLDRSGGGYDFFRGADGSATATDPTFNGSAGGLSSSEYFSFDGGDYFTYDSANEAWMNNYHKDNAKLTICAWIYFGGAGKRIFGNNANDNAHIGFNIRGTGSSEFSFQVSNGATILDAKTAAGVLTTGVWHFVAASVDEAAGASGGLLFVDGAATAFNAAYASPSSSAASFTTQIGTLGDSANIISSGSRIAFLAAWEGVALTQSQIESIYNATDTLVANAGGCALTGQSASFRTTLPAATASDALSGQAASFIGRLTATLGSDTLAGQAASFKISVPAAVASYTLSGIAAQMAMPVGTGSFACSGVSAPLSTVLDAAMQGYTLTGNAATVTGSMPVDAAGYALTGIDAYLSHDIDLGGIGGRIAGGQFTRGQWHDFKETQRRAREAALLEIERIERAAREASEREAASERARVAAARFAENRANARRARQQAAVDALAALSGVRRAAAAIGQANMIALAAEVAQAQRVADQEDEEAIVHLLLAE